MAVRLLRTGVAAVLLLLCGAGLASAATRPHLRAAVTTRSTVALQRSLSGYLREAGGTTSGLVVDETTGQTLFSANPNTLRLPASVEKLFTTSAALFDLGSSYRFNTSLDGIGKLANGTFTGQLYLRGGGDPTFGAASFDARMYGTGATVQGLLRGLRDAGVTQIKGSIIGDASIFDSHGGGPDTGYRASSETEGELSGLAYDAGWTSSAEQALQPRPALWAAQALATVAPASGIKVARGTRITTGTTPASARLLAEVASPALSTLVKLTNAPSDNFFAETLDKDLGRRIAGTGSTSAGASVVEKTIRSDLGLVERTDDGSGLSRYDRTTATTVVELLEEMEPSLAFYNSLAVAGVSGTMVDEMLNTPAANNCRGKTGTLHDVANLVGYCLAANGDRLVYAFLENGLPDATFGHETEDLMGEALANYKGNGRGTAAPVLPQPLAGEGVPKLASSPSSTGASAGAGPSSASGTSTGSGSGSGSGAGGTSTTSTGASAGGAGF